MTTSTGEADLSKLLMTMSPTLHPEIYVFLTTTQSIDTLPLHILQPQMLFQEAEGLTIITAKRIAEAQGFNDYTFPCKKLSLEVHSSLQAVGLIAAISNRLAQRDISTNVVSGYYHDHIFVPVDKGEESMGVLEEMIMEARDAKSGH